MVRQFLEPVRILWTKGNVSNAKELLTPGNGQADLSSRQLCVLTSTAKKKPGILLDFGKELQGGLQLVTGYTTNAKPVKIRLRFGESVAEAMSDVNDTTKNATNDEAMRDEVVSLPWLGKLETGNTGFRFVRIDLVDDNTVLALKEVSAISIYRNIPYLGSFNSSDTLLNQIWLTGAYTVQLNMQDYLLDGIKRDRLVWMGDMNPEVASITSVFGYNEVVPKSMDFVRDQTPLPNYMNNTISYSMWWVITQYEWYMHNGNLGYLQQQKSYLIRLIKQLMSQVDKNNTEVLDGGYRFLDWPSKPDTVAIHAGLQAMLVMTLIDGAKLCKILKDQGTAAECENMITRLKKNVPTYGQSKQAAALLALSGLLPSTEADSIISKDGVHRYSTFFGYYMLTAKAMAKDYQGAIDAIRTYWGGMLNMGATTFWEDFDIDWMNNASPIDELVPAGKKDIHGDYGAYCYIGYRKSLCHGWASGPTAWLSTYVLGIHIMAPGCRVIKIEPHLGDLTFAEGTFPTPMGVVKVKHVKRADGTIRTIVHAPKGIRIIK